MLRLEAKKRSGFIDAYTDTYIRMNDPIKRYHCIISLYTFLLLVDLTKLTTMVSELSEMVRRGQLLEPICTEVPFKDYKKALQACMDQYSVKHVLIMN